MFDRDALLAFVNTRLDRPSGLVDALADPEQAARWLGGHLDLAPLPLRREGEHEELLRFRDAVRALTLARSAGLAPDREDLAIVNRASVRAPRALQLAGGWRRADAFSSTGSTHPGSLPELMADLAGATVDLLSDPGVDLAECAADDCVVLFLRTDPRRRWHSDRCGNRMRAARSYARRKRPNQPKPGV